MFKLNEKYEIKRIVLKCDYICFSPADTSTINALNSQIYHKIPKEDFDISLLNIYLDLNFEVIEEADNSRYANVDDLRLVNQRLIAFFSIFKFTTSSRRLLEDSSYAHKDFLMYKLKISAKDCDDLSIGFDRDRNRKQNELTNSKNIKCNYHVRITLKDVFDFVEGQKSYSRPWL